MSKKNWWYAFLGILPAYGANNSLQQFGEPWTGLLAGAIVAALLFGIIKGIQLVIQKVSGTKDGNKP